MAAPRKAADWGMDGGHSVRGSSGQEARPERKSAGGVSESAYVRKSSGVSATSLPLKRQPQANQGEYRAGDNGSGAKGRLKMGVD